MPMLPKKSAPSTLDVTLWTFLILWSPTWPNFASNSTKFHLTNLLRNSFATRWSATIMLP